VTGERSGQAGWSNPSKTVLQEMVTGGSIHQFLWRRSRAASNAKWELSGQERNRNRSESSQVRQAGFRPERIAVTLRVNGCYCASARGGWLWRSSSEGRPKERRRKAGQSEHSHREGDTAKAELVKTFQDAGDVKNDTAVM